ncbi:MAG: TonB-dependent receptor [Ginsengibacter sp.]
MKLLSTLLFFITLSAFSFAQDKGANIAGKITDNNEKPLSQATVALLKAKDSSLVKTSVTNTAGVFNIINVKSGDYFLSVTSVGHKKNTGAIFNVTDGQDFTAPVVVLSQSSTSLAEVTVQAKKPMIEVRADKTIFNVESSINATGSNAFELLQKSPGVSTDKDDNISMQGKNGVKIYIDGKPTQMGGADLAAYLRSINSADIESIEMITNPSAKYEASGNAGIINIKLKKNKNFGANGNFSTGVNFGHTPKNNNSLSLNYRNKKVSLFSNYSNSFGTNQFNFHLYRVQGDSIYDQQNVMSNNNKTHNVKAGIDYSLDAKNTIGVMVTANFNNSDNNTNGNTLITPNSTKIPLKTLEATNIQPGTRTNIDYNLNYRFADNKGSELNIDADMVNFRRRGSSFQPNYYRAVGTGALLEQKIYRNNTPTDIDIFTAKVDYETPLYKGKLGFGGKYSDTKTNNIFDFYNVYGGTDYKDINRSNKFNYKENVNALYVNYNTPLSKKTTIQAGVRVENTISQGNLLAAVPKPDDKVKRNYTNLFPSGAITYMLDKNSTLNLSYSRRIDRPNYQDLNPFEDRLDELTYRKGNAFLRPQYTNAFQLSHTFKYRYVTSIGYSHITDYFAQIIDTVGNKGFITQKNIAEQNIFSLNFSAPVTITKWWNAFATFNGYHSAYKANFGQGKIININVNAFSVYTQQTFSVKKGPSFELSGFFNSPTVWGGTFKSKALGFVDVGVQQQILKKQGTIKVSYTDIFHTLKWKGISDFGGTYLIASGNWESQQLKVNFSYRFGNSQVKAARQRKAAADEESKRLNQSGGIGEQ